MKKSLLVGVVSALWLLAAVSSNVFAAYTDAQLISIRDAFGTRRDGMLSSQVSSPYPSGSDTSSYVWRQEDYALAALYLNTQVTAANQAIIDACTRQKSDPTDYDANFHWKGNLFFRIYKYFGHDAKDPNFRGRLTPAAEAAICDVFWYWAKYKSVVADTELKKSRTWYLWGSENHDAQRDTTSYSAAAILKDVAPYNTYTYDDGFTAQQHYDAWNSYFKEYLRQRGKKGLLVEIGSPTYAKYTLQGWYNFYDFAQDPCLADLSRMTLDLWWADWAHDEINGVRGGGKARVYQDGSDRYAANDCAYAMCWYYLNVGSANSKHPGIMCLATSKYRLPLVVMDLALDITGRGTYEYKSRRQGLNLLPPPTGLPSDVYALDPNFGGIFRYTYATPYYVMGSLMFEKRSGDDWSGISSQNRWQGVIFKKNVDARIVPQCIGNDGSGRTYNQYWSVQNKGTLITQKLTTADPAGDMRVYFSKKPLKFTSVAEENGWIFVSNTDSYAAVKPAWGTYTWDDPNWIHLSDTFAPVIIEVAQSTDYGNNFTTFKTAVKALPLTYVNNVLTYIGLGSNGTFTFYTNSSQLPLINGQPINLKPTYTFDSPFMHEDWASGTLTISKSGRSDPLDFNKYAKDVCGDWGHFSNDFNNDCKVDMLDLLQVADNWLVSTYREYPTFDQGPFADNANTLALWHMDSSYTGIDGITRVADDNSVNTSRHNNLQLGSAGSGHAISTQPTLLSPGFNGAGACLSFDGVDDECVADLSWLGYDSVLVDVWIYPTDGAGTNVIVEATSTWSLSIGNNAVGFTTWHSDNSNNSLNWPTGIMMNAWHHIQAVFTNQGHKYLTQDGQTITWSSAVPLTLVRQTKGITMGNKPTFSRFFNGYMDEVRIATVDPQGYCINTVNLKDYAAIAQDWLKCTEPGRAGCTQLQF